MADRGNPCPAGPTDAAARFLAAAAAADGRNQAERQLAALQGIGWAVLAIGDHLADTNDTGTDLMTGLADIAQRLADLHRPPLTDRVRTTLSRLPSPPRGVLIAVSGGVPTDGVPTRNAKRSST